MATKGKILFDQGHAEDYLQALMDRLPDEGFVYDVSDEPLTARRLEPYTGLILANPRAKFSEDEIRDVVEYAKSGCGVLLTAYFLSEAEYEGFRENTGYGESSLTQSLLDTELKARKLFPMIIGYETGGIVYNFFELLKEISWWVLGEPTSGYKIEIINPGVWIGRTTYEYKPFSKENEISRFQLPYHPIIKNATKIDSDQEGIIGWYEEGSYEILFLNSFHCYETHKIYTGQGRELSRRNLTRRSRILIDKIMYEELDKFSNRGIANTLSKGRAVGIYGNLFDDEYIEQDEEKNSNLRLALNILEWISQPTLYRLRRKPVTKPRRESTSPFVYRPRKKLT